MEIPFLDLSCNPEFLVGFQYLSDPSQYQRFWSTGKEIKVLAPLNAEPNPTFDQFMLLRDWIKVQWD